MTKDEDPLAGAETWTSEDIATSIDEFQGLIKKMNRIQDLYAVKAQTIDPNDEKAQARVASKMEKVAEKRRQLIEALSKLRRIQHQREEAVEPTKMTMLLLTLSPTHQQLIP